MLSDGLGVIGGRHRRRRRGALGRGLGRAASQPQADRLSGTATARAAIRLLRRVFIMVSLRRGADRSGSGRCGRADWLSCNLFRAGCPGGGHATRTTTSWMPLEPSGNGVAPLVTWRPPVAVGRAHARGCGGRAWRPTAGTTGASSRRRRPGRARAGCHGPSSTLHLDVPDAAVLGPGHAADRGPAGLDGGEGPGGVDPGRDLDRGVGGPVRARSSTPCPGRTSTASAG